MSYCCIPLGLFLGLSACQAQTGPVADNPQASQASQASQIDVPHPLLGCWESDDGLEREVWTTDPSGWMIGYAASRNADGGVTFFEHMRVEQGSAEEVLVVTGAGNDGPVRFVRALTNDTNIRGAVRRADFRYHRRFCAAFSESGL